MELKKNLCSVVYEDLSSYWPGSDTIRVDKDWGLKQIENNPGWVSTLQTSNPG